jgi:hypothetical protein
MIFFLYRIILPDGRMYFGVAKNPQRRFVEHRRRPYVIGQEIRKSKSEDVKYEILVCGESQYIFELETKAVAAFNTRWPAGLNVAVGGSGGRDHLPMIREKISRICTGKKKTPEAKRRISAARMGWVPSLETRAKLAAAGRGKKMPEHVKAKISAALIGRNVRAEAASAGK